jgi:D-alanine-D-alanine ligase
MSGNSRQNVAVLFGGRSVEHEISVISGLQIIKAMDVVKYKPIPVYVAPSGKWYSGEALLDRQFYKNMPASFSQVQEITLLPDPTVKGLTVVQNQKSKFSLFPKKEENVIPMDIFFLAFHGSYGEDGCMQGLMELADMPYAGSDVTSSSISMDKQHSKTIVSAAGVPVLPSLVVHKSAAESQLGPDLDALRSKIHAHPGLEKFPLFVKPATLGSSIGVGKASDDSELDAALLEAFQYDTAAIIEPCLTNKLEINVSIMEHLDGASPIASVVEIPVPAQGGELTYEDKYMRGGSKKTGNEPSGMAGLVRIIDPQDLDVQIRKQVQDYGIKAFTALGSSGLVRIDFMQDLDSGTIYFNEINPLPGSFSFYLWEKNHPPVLFTDLINVMLESAERRHKAKHSVSREIAFRALFK